MNKLDLKNLINKVDMNNVNIKLIKSNVKYLIDIYKNIKKNWILLDNKFKITKINDKSNNKEYEHIKKMVIKSIFNDYDAFNNFVEENDEIVCLEYENIKLYYYVNSKNNSYKNDLEEMIKLLKITICIKKLYLKNDDISRIIIWIPIPINRDFSYNEINSKNLKKSTKNFTAFTTSGVTYGQDPRITIITRYEEVEKLLIHELIHNFYIDGTLYHDELKSIINNYEKVKNKNKNTIENYSYEYSIYESYTELTSTYLILLFNNIEEKIDNLEDKLLSNIIIELFYSYNTIVNLIKLNGYESWEEFIKSEIFYGKICVYEYYYLKAIMYNNFNFRICKNYNDFKKLYYDIISIIDNIKNEKLLIDIFKFSIKQDNFKYMLLN
jgi:hypothetical protein